MEWSNENVQLFIELYEEEPAIWNPKDPAHKSRSNVHDAWTRIKTKFCDGRVSVEELKKKKDNLMATYRKLNAKVKSRSGGSGMNKFKPNWPFYEQMAKFLHGVYKPTISSEYTVDPDDETETEVVMHEENESFTDTTINSVIFKMATNKNNVNRKRKIEHQMEQEYKVHKTNAEPEPVEDVCTLYTKLLCAKLKSMDTFSRDIAMHEIDNLMFRLKQQAFPRSISPSNESYAECLLPDNPIASPLMQSSVKREKERESPNQLSPRSHTHWRANFKSSPQSHSQQSADFQPSPKSDSQQSDFKTSPQSHSQQDFKTSPQSHSQQDFKTSPQSDSQQSDFQPSLQSHSQQDFKTSPQSHSQQDFKTSPQSHSQQDFKTSPQSHSQQDFKTSLQSHSQEDFKKSPQSHSQQDFKTSLQSHSQEDFKTSPQSHSQQSFKTSPQSDS